MASHQNEVPLTILDLGDVKPSHRGKVREMFDLGDQYLMVATDRISAFDVILPQGVPGKGKVLTAVSLAWLDALEGIVPHHLISQDPADFPAEFHPFREILEGRSLLVHKAKRFDVECVVRGYLAGSGWKDYQHTGGICGISLPPDLQNSQQLPEPIFTPATKADEGHDENIPFEEMIDIVGRDYAEHLRELSMKLYSSMARAASHRGFIVADTKFEFGLVGGEIAVIDEIMTPDSSRFWPEDGYQVGRSQESFDKQPVRDYLETTGWNKQPPPPDLPEEVVQATSQRYQEVMHRLADPQNPIQIDVEFWS